MGGIYGGTEGGIRDTSPQEDHRGHPAGANKGLDVLSTQIGWYLGGYPDKVLGAGIWVSWRVSWSTLLGLSWDLSGDG